MVHSNSWAKVQTGTVQLEAVAARERRAQLVCLTSCLSAVILLANSVSVILCLFVHISPPWAEVSFQKLLRKWTRGMWKTRSWGATEMGGRSMSSLLSNMPLTAHRPKGSIHKCTTTFMRVRYFLRRFRKEISYYHTHHFPLIGSYHTNTTRYGDTWVNYQQTISTYLG